MMTFKLSRIESNLIRTENASICIFFRLTLSLMFFLPEIPHFSNLYVSLILILIPQEINYFFSYIQ